MELHERLFKTLIPSYRKVDFFIIAVCFLSVLLTDLGMVADFLNKLDFALALPILIFIGVKFALLTALKPSRPRDGEIQSMVLASVVLTASASIIAGYVAVDAIGKAASDILDIVTLIFAVWGVGWGSLSGMFMLMGSDSSGFRERLNEKFIEGDISRGMAWSIVFLTFSFALAYKFAFQAHWSYTLLMGIFVITSATHLMQGFWANRKI